MKKRILSLALVLALCLGLAVPAMAAGTTEVIEDTRYGIKITLNGFLRKEINKCEGINSGRVLPVTIYVVEDHSTATVEALPGVNYCPEDEWGEMGECAYIDTSCLNLQNNSLFHMPVNGEFPLSQPFTGTIEPTEKSEYGEYEGIVSHVGSVWVVCESDFAKLPVFDSTLKASAWAQEALGKAFEAGLFPTYDSSINPFQEDCTRNMTRAEFAEITVNLYKAMGGIFNEGLRMEGNHPFTDVYSADYGVSHAYQLGFVNGTGDTTFDPEGTLTREQAAVMLSRVYAKLHGDIPAVTATTFADDASVGGWAKSGVAFMADKGIVDGVGDNNFAPKKTLSIQEAMTMAQRMLEKLG